MPNRLVYEGLLDSEVINSLSDAEFRLYVHLLLAADDAGRFDGRAAVLRSNLFPLDDSRRVSDVQKLVQEAADKRALILYEFEGKPFIQIAKWRKYNSSLNSKYPDQNGLYQIRYVRVPSPKGDETEFVDTSLSRFDGVSTPSRPPKDPVPARTAGTGTHTGSGPGTSPPKSPRGLRGRRGRLNSEEAAAATDAAVDRYERVEAKKHATANGK